MTILARSFPLLAPALRRIIGPDTPEIDILQPAESEAVTPPAYLPGTLERAVGTVEGNDLSYYLQVATETVVTHAPVLREMRRNAIVRRRGYATPRSHERLGPGFGLSELLAPVTEVGTLRYCYSHVIWQYFGHWLTDGIPSALIDPGLGPLFMPPIPGSAHARDYLDATGLQLIEAPLIHARELVSYQDYGQGSHKRARYQELNRRLLARFGNDDPAACVFIKRGRTGVPRFIANEDALVETLLARNWTVLDIAKASVTEMQRVLTRATVVVSIEGSQLDHAILSMPEGAAMVILEPQDRFLLRFVGLCRARRIKPGFLIVKGSLATGYTVDFEELFRTIDLTVAS